MQLAVVISRLPVRTTSAVRSKSQSRSRTTLPLIHLFNCARMCEREGENVVIIYFPSFPARRRVEEAGSDIVLHPQATQPPFPPVLQGCPWPDPRNEAERGRAAPAAAKPSLRGCSPPERDHQLPGIQVCVCVCVCVCVYVLHNFAKRIAKKRQFCHCNTFALRMNGEWMENEMVERVVFVMCSYGVSLCCVLLGWYGRLQNFLLE